MPMFILSFGPGTKFDLTLSHYQQAPATDAWKLRWATNGVGDAKEVWRDLRVQFGSPKYSPSIQHPWT